MQKTNAQFVPVPRNVEDPFYRYKMPVLRVKVQGRGKMIKTVLLNLDSIAHALERPVDYLLKFIGFECGAPVANQSNQFTVGGDRKVEELNEILDVFIDKYILCSMCKNPETILEAKKGDIVLSCRACGTQTRVHFEHKLTDFIVKKERTSDKISTKKKATTKSDYPSEVLHLFWEQKPDKQEILSKVEQIQTKQGWTADQMLRIVFGSLFDKDILDEFDSKAEIYSLFTSSPKYEGTTLFCIEKLCTLEKSIIPFVATILEKFYDHQLLKAENIKQWFEHMHPKIDKNLAQQIRENAKPFVENLS